jgi:hypothetical protein
VRLRSPAAPDQLSTPGRDTLRQPLAADDAGLAAGASAVGPLLALAQLDGRCSNGHVSGSARTRAAQSGAVEEIGHVPHGPKTFSGR